MHSASFLAQILTQLHEVPLLFVVRSVVKTGGNVESGDDGVEIVFNFHTELPEQCHQSPSVAPARLGIAPNRVCNLSFRAENCGQKRSN